MSERRLIGPVHPEAIKRIWGRIEPHIQKLVEHEGPTQGLTVNALAEGMLSRKWDTWVFNDLSATLLTSIYAQQNGRLIMTVNMAGGEDLVNSVDVAHRDISHYARDNGCFAIEILGRKGWERATRELGYKHDYSAWICPLEGER